MWLKITIWLKIFNHLQNFLEFLVKNVKIFNQMVKNKKFLTRLKPSIHAGFRGFWLKG